MKYSNSFAVALGALITLSAGCKDATQPTPVTSQAPTPRPGPIGDYIHVANTDGSAVTLLTRGYAPRWSPDGTRLAYHGRTTNHGAGSAEIFVIDADGSRHVQLTRNTDDDLEPRWSPRGDRIAFVRKQRYGSSQLVVMNADGSNVTALTSDAMADVGSPVWSPDGRRLAFYYGTSRNSAGAIAVINEDGSGLSRLASVTIMSRPAWFPDGRIAFMNADGGISVMNADGSALMQLTSGGHDHEAVWSPDGGKIAFTRSFPTGRDFVPDEIWVMNADGTEQTKLVGDGFRPQWLPDGRHIIYSSIRQSSLGEGIAVVPLSGGAPKMLVPGGYGARLSPDGMRIIFEATSPL